MLRESVLKSPIGEPGVPMDRAAVRALALRIESEATWIRSKGGNIHQFELDLQDHVQKFATTLPTAEEQVAFLDLFQQETDALAAHERELQAVRTQRDEQVLAGAHSVGTAIGAIITIALIVVALLAIYS